MKEDWLWVVIIGGVIIIGLLGGFKNPDGTNFSFFTPASTTPQTKEQEEAQIQQEILIAKAKVEELQKQIQAEQDAKIYSKYRGVISIRYVNRWSDVSQEQIQLYVSGKTETPINITGWTLTSTSSGATVKIPKATYLFFAGSPNTEEDVYVNTGDTIYISSGYSPNGYSFQTNKCIGYLSQFQTWSPSLPYNCPLPKNENLSGIPQTVINDACLDYIDRYPQCRIQTEALPLNWSYECTNFIYTKINYPSCVSTHKDDADFYGNEWRLYLKRTEKIWKSSRENIVLYDHEGKIVDIHRY